MRGIGPPSRLYESLALPLSYIGDEVDYAPKFSKKNFILQ